MTRGTKPKPSLLTQEVAGILRGQLGRKRLTQAQVAVAAQISTTQLSGIFNGTKSIDLDQLDRICWAIGLEPNEVLEEAVGETVERHLEDEWTSHTLVEW